MLLEPIGRNTAPAITLAALAALDQGSDPVLVVSPADHAVADVPAFVDALRAAIQEAAAGSISVLGVTPDRPETGYGYIKATHSPSLAHVVERFVEKPDLSTAQRYVREGSYYWNSGIFVFRASTWLAALGEFRPDIVASTRPAWEKRSIDQCFIRPGKAEFESIPAESADYAVMERSPGRFSVRMVPLCAGWSDLGAWDAVWNALPKDDSGNACVGDVLTLDSRNVLVQASSRFVSLVGVTDLVVIETADAVLVADRARSQEVGAIVRSLTSSRRKEHVFHRKVHRPWGWYDSVDEGERFRVKRIQVNPMSSLSLQKHHHRAEHWVVVRGTAEVTCGDTTRLLTENQSTYIPLGQTHRLTNPGSGPLEIVEVQSGSYLGEDDIVRLQDSYGR